MKKEPIIQINAIDLNDFSLQNNLNSPVNM
jgi:hypothetical protein